MSLFLGTAWIVGGISKMCSYCVEILLGPAHALRHLVLVFTYISILTFSPPRPQKRCRRGSTSLNYPTHPFLGHPGSEISGGRALWEHTDHWGGGGHEDSVAYARLSYFHQNGKAE
jgi:hypothetical protein